MEQTKVQETVKAISSLVNSYSDHSEEFNSEMEREHRTLQNSFSKLCFAWIEHIASDAYRTDARNQSSKDIAQKLLTTFKKQIEMQGYTDSSLELMSTPSKYCRMI